MSEKEPSQEQLRRDYEAALSRVSQVIRSHNNAIRLVDAKAVSNARTLAELQAICTSLRDSTATSTERLADKLDLLVDLARDSRADMRQALSELRAANDRLGVQRDEIKALLATDRYTPTHVPLPPRETETEPEEGISVRHGKLTASFGFGTIWGAVKKYGGYVGWASGGLTAMWHGARHFLGH